MQKIKNIICVALLAAVGLLVTIVSPLTVLFASIGMFAFLAIARQMNFQRILAMLKGYAKNVARIRFEIRAKLHTGFRDYSDSADSEESHNRTCGFIR
jgi:hypothetical protein